MSGKIFDYQEECPYCNMSMGFSFKRLHPLSYKDKFRDVRLMKCKSACCQTYIWMRMKPAEDDNSRLDKIHGIAHAALGMASYSNDDVNYQEAALEEIIKLCTDRGVAQ